MLISAVTVWISMWLSLNNIVVFNFFLFDKPILTMVYKKKKKKGFWCVSLDLVVTWWQCVNGGENPIIHCGSRWGISGAVYHSEDSWGASSRCQITGGSKKLENNHLFSFLPPLADLPCRLSHLFPVSPISPLPYLTRPFHIWLLTHLLALVFWAL